LRRYGKARVRPAGLPVSYTTGGETTLTALTMIAENGGSAHAIMAWGGHKTLAEAQRYTQAAALKRLGFGNGTGPERSKPGPDSCKPAINRSTNKTLHGGW
ncbi:hypothetical protein KY389_12140, partial [Paracoccus bogoriensis]|nr:hypothetical protein [Paracoccus bogoriensis]